MTFQASNLRIISLLPSATEILFAIGAGLHVVGVTHECDHPSEASNLAHCTGNLLPPNLSARQIDDAVAAALLDDEHSIYRLNVEKVKALKPSVIVTQSLCAVCAVPEKTVQKLSCTLPLKCRVVSSNPQDLAGLFETIVNIGAAIGFEESAKQLVFRLKKRLLDVRNSVPATRPRVVVLEWPDPPYAPGHWVPDMIQSVGGICLLGKPGERSKRVTWSSLIELRPDVVVSAFCGYNLKENETESDKVRHSPDWKAFVAHANVYATNASAYFSRPGNRLVDGTELLAYILYKLPQYKPSKESASILKNGKWVDLSIA